MQTNIELVLDGKKSDLGDSFIVRRSLPQAKKRMVGPFIFLDHMGPVSLTPGHEMKVRSHPHIGLSTLTYLFQGEILHRDSLGNELTIKPGEVNWMTAGRGIAHSERTLPQSGPLLLEGIQLWIALPKSSEEIDPSFVHVEEKNLPKIKIADSDFILIAGEAFGKKSPVPVYSPLFYLSGKMNDGDRFQMDMDPRHESAVYVAKGKINIDGSEYTESQLIVFKVGSQIEFSALDSAHVMILGGEVFPEKRFIFWNFVSSSEERLERAKSDWSEGRFAKVINEEESIPLPNSSSGKT